MKFLDPSQYVSSSVYHISECLCHVSLAVTVLLTACLSIERHQAVCLPHSYQARIVSTGHAKLLASYLVPTMTMATTLNIPRYGGFEIKLQELYLVSCMRLDLHVCLRRF